MERSSISFAPRPSASTVNFLVLALKGQIFSLVKETVNNPEASLAATAYVENLNLSGDLLKQIPVPGPPPTLTHLTDWIFGSMLLVKISFQISMH